MRRAEEAAAAAQRIADRLCDPFEVAAVARRSQSASTRSFVTWTGFSLGGGHAGVALALAGFADADGRHLSAARQHLAAAADEHRRHGAYGAGLYEGLAGPGYAAAATARQPGDCARVLDACRAEAVAVSAELVAVLDRRGDDRTFMHYDVIEGLAGLTRFLLMREGPGAHDTVEAVRGLVDFLCRPTPRQNDGPPWQVRGNPGLLDGRNRPVVDLCEDRLLDLGMAHGVAGVMSVLAVASLAGVRVPDLDAAIDTAATWLVGWRAGAATGGWPTAVWPSEDAAKRSGMGDRMAWCYGTPGVAAALCLAGRALGRDDLGKLGREELVRTCVLLEARGSTDMGICHGWSGIAAILMSVLDGGGTVQIEAEIEAALDRVIDRIIDQQDDALPFLHRYPGTDAGSELDDATFLTGAAGTAAVLNAYGQGAIGQGAYGQGAGSSTHWRDVLMLG